MGPLTLVWAKEAYESWSLNEALELLNNSSWSHQETYTRVIGGIGSGLQGEKEIYSTYFVRFLSAAPIRQAYARIKQIQLGYEDLEEVAQEELGENLRRGLAMDMSDWIVVAVTFRSNDPAQETQVEQFFQSQTKETLQPRVFLSTTRYLKLQLSAYYPPKEASVGAKFVFPRRVDGDPVVSEEDSDVTFELDIAGMVPDLRAIFSVPDMIVDGEVVI
jgi:hypothetical protein